MHERALAMLPLLLPLLAPIASAQPPSTCSSSLGQASSNACVSVSSCSTSTPNSSTYAVWSGSWSAGVFTGTLTANGCPHDVRAWQQSSVAVPWLTTTSSIGGGGSPLCCQTTFPVSAYTSPPKAANVIGAIGFAIHGENIYGPFDNGFTSTTQNLCSSGSGGCPKLSDVGNCEAFAEATCGTSNTRVSWFMSDCGGHASPWHYHTSMNCALTANATFASLAATDGHSPLTGVMLDGRGLYGPYETTTAAPSNLDACNGHVGPVPAYSSTINGATVTAPAAASVYHYHTSAGPPYTIGCFGPVASVAAAKALYPDACAGGSGACSASAQLSAGCGSGYTWSGCTSKGALSGYLLGCPVYQGVNGAGVMEYNTPQFPVATSACPACTGNCIAGSSSSSSGSGSSSSSLAIGLGVGLGLFAVIVGGSAATYCWWKKTHAGAVSHDVPVKGVVSV